MRTRKEGAEDDRNLSEQVDGIAIGDKMWKLSTAYLISNMLRLENENGIVEDDSDPVRAVDGPRHKRVVYDEEWVLKCVAKFGPENSQSKTICDHDDVRPMSMDHGGRFDASSILSDHIAGSFEQ